MILRDIPQLKPPSCSLEQILGASGDYWKFACTEFSNPLKRQQVLFLSRDEVRTVYREQDLMLFDMIADGAHTQVLNPSFKFNVHTCQSAFVDFNSSHSANGAGQQAGGRFLKPNANGL
jgi:hypothetical protein